MDLKLEVLIDNNNNDDGYICVTINAGYDSSLSYSNNGCENLTLDEFVAQCVADYLQRIEVV